MNLIQKKLRSGKGASITFALLLFLICAVFSSMALVAATTSSGRLAGIVGTDQRYYAVTSASELMKDLLDGKTASVVVVGEGDEAKTFVFDKAAYEVTDADIAGDSNPNLVTDSFKFKSVPQAAVYAYYQGKHPAEGEVVTWPREVGKFTLTGLPAELGVDVTVVVDDDGSVGISVSKKDKNDKAFIQRLVFSGTENDDGTTSVSDQSLKTTTLTLTWSLTDVRTL